MLLGTRIISLFFNRDICCQRLTPHPIDNQDFISQSLQRGKRSPRDRNKKKCGNVPDDESYRVAS
jgi:hypothetical protein